MEKTSVLLTTTILLSALSGTVYSAGTDPAFAVIEAGPNHQVLQSIGVDPAGQPTTNTVVALASCMNWLNPKTGQYEPGQTAFDIAEDGSAVISRAQTKIIASANVNNPEGALDILTVDDRRLRCTVIGICLFDAVTGRQLQVAAVRDSVAELVAPDTLLWRDCFEGLQADLRVVYRPGELHHDIILRQRVGPEFLQAAGLQEEGLRIEAWTEFFEAPEPQRDAMTLKETTEPEIRKSMAEPDLLDEALDFGEFELASGSAFADSDRDSLTSVPVGKQFFSADGRSFLVESCDWGDLRPILDALPIASFEAAAADSVPGARPGLPSSVSSRRTPPRPPSGGIPAEVLVASTKEQSPGVVLDFVGLSGTLTGYVFSNQTYQISGTVTLASSVLFEGGAVLKFNPGAKLNVSSTTAISCATEPYEPVIMTARDDSTVGSAVSGATTLSGYYANPALNITRSSSAAAGELDNFRILYATKGINFSGNYYGSSPTSRNFQFVHCASAIDGQNGGTVKILNALFHDIGKVLDGLSSTTIQSQHCTISDADYFNYSPSSSPVSLVNSLLVAVGSAGTYSGTSVGVEADGTEVFEELGGGLHYLQIGSVHRNVGVTSIDATLAAQLAKKTTYAPAELSTAITQDTILEPHIWRDVDIPDRGYHYDPIDFAVNTLEVTGTTLTLTNGVVIATYGQNGLWLNTASILRSIGRPEERNHICRFSAVMEQPLNWGGGDIGNHAAVNPYHASGAAPIVECRFTDFETPADGGYHIYAFDPSWKISSLALQDCEFSGGWLSLDQGAGSTISLKNNLLLRSGLNVVGSQTVSLYNNLFRRGSVIIERSSGTWIVKDNVFDRCPISTFGPLPTHGHNAYVSTSGRIGTAQTGDVTLSTLAYYVGDLGRFYQSSSSSLRDGGSRTNAEAGLAQYTSSINYAKDTGNVAIGLHYVATLSKLPIDSDEDGVPDYMEDVNGNGLPDSGETGALNSDSNGDGILDGEALAAPAQCYHAEYTCDAKRDFSMIGRLSELTDATFTMRWQHRGMSMAYSTLDCAECVSQPPWNKLTVLYAWTDAPCGLETKWNNDQGIYFMGPVWRPGTAYFPIPGEYCQLNRKVMSEPEFRSDEIGTYERSARTTMHLQSYGREYPKVRGSITLSLSMIDKTALGSIEPLEHGLAPHGERLKEPDDRWDGTAIHPQATAILVLGEMVDANGECMVRLPRGGKGEISPLVTSLPSPQWIQYSFVITPIHKVRLSWSQYPAGTVPDGQIQAAFDTGAREIGREGRLQAERIDDNDPRLPNSAPFDPLDHTPTYLEYFAPKAQSARFPAPYNTDSRYWILRDRIFYDELQAEPFANIKVVKELYDEDDNDLPAATDAIHDSVIITEAAISSKVLLHESMHLMNVWSHRDNPLPAPGALMNRYVEDCMWELNRTERDTVYNHGPPVFRP